MAWMVIGLVIFAVVHIGLIILYHLYFKKRFGEVVGWILFFLGYGYSFFIVDHIDFVYSDMEMGMAIAIGAGITLVFMIIVKQMFLFFSKTNGDKNSDTI